MLGDYALKHYTGFTLGDNDQIQLAGCFQIPESAMTISSSPIDDVGNRKTCFQSGMGGMGLLLFERLYQYDRYTSSFFLLI
jgi:hypothetical protein